MFSLLLFGKIFEGTYRSTDNILPNMTTSKSSIYLLVLLKNQALGFIRTCECVHYLKIAAEL